MITRWNTGWNEFEQMFSAMNELRTRMDRMFEDAFGGWPSDGRALAFQVKAPEGYSAHRQERPAVRFSRSFALPCRVNPEKATAAVKNGILTVTLEKAADAMPRQIAVKASS
jgi:hypothetical protein